MGNEEKREPGDVEKEVAFYSAVVAAWVETRMERDRSLLTLSSAGIGLLVTLLTTVGARTCWQLTLYILAMTAFLTTIVSAVIVFGRNASYMGRLAKKQDAPDDKLLVQLDALLMSSFLVGAALLATLGIASAWVQFRSHGG